MPVEADIPSLKEWSAQAQSQNGNMKFEETEPCSPEQTKVRKSARKHRKPGSRSVHIPSDCIITAKVLIAVMRQLHTDEIEEIAEAAIQELDARIGDCDLEPEYDCDVDDDHPMIHSAASTRKLPESPRPQVALHIIRKT